MSCDQQVIGTDRTACRGEFSPDGTRFAGCGSRPGQNLDVLQECADDAAQVVTMLAPQDPILQLKEGDDGDPELKRGEAFTRSISAG
jgi:hypothetical protein